MSFFDGNRDEREPRKNPKLTRFKPPTETLLDLLELYTHHRNQTAVGPEFPVDVFLSVRIPLNQESEARRLPRFTEWLKIPNEKNVSGYGPLALNGAANGSHHSRSSSKNVSPKDVTSPSTNSSSGPGSGSTAATSVPGAAQGGRPRIGERGREGTIRFILNPDREREEREVVETFRRG